MLPVNEPLFHAIVAAVHDPDPERAFRYHPWVYDGRRRPSEGTLAWSGFRFGRDRLRVAHLAVVQPLRRLFVRTRPAAEVACAVPCAAPCG